MGSFGRVTTNFTNCFFANLKANIQRQKAFREGSCVIGCQRLRNKFSSFFIRETRGFFLHRDPAHNSAVKVFIQAVLPYLKRPSDFTNKKIFAFCGVLLTAVAQEKMSDPVAEAIEQADKVYEEDKLKEYYDILIVHKDAGNPEILWRLARACRRLSQLPTANASDKKNLTYEGLEYAEKAVKADSNSGAAQKWNGIMLSEVGDFEGTKKKIENSYIIKEHFEKAINMLPSDATSRYLMGRWCFTFAELPWYQRKLAQAIFGTPPTSTYEEALAFFEEAEKLSPGFYTSNLLMIAKCYLGLKKKEEAKPWLEKVVNSDMKTEDDKQAVKEATSLLK